MLVRLPKNVREGVKRLVMCIVSRINSTISLPENSRTNFNYANKMRMLNRIPIRRSKASIGFHRLPSASIGFHRLPSGFLLTSPDSIRTTICPSVPYSFTDANRVIFASCVPSAPHENRVRREALVLQLNGENKSSYRPPKFSIRKILSPLKIKLFEKDKCLKN